MNCKTILIVSGCKYPEGDAGSVRIHALAKLFEKCGYKTIVIGKGAISSGEKQNNDGIDYYSFRQNKPDIIGKIKDTVGFTDKLRKHLVQCGSNYSHILIVDVPFRAIRYAKTYASKKGIQLLHDSLEWYSKSEFKYGRLNPMYRHRDKLNRKVIDKDFKIIAISRYLEDYFIDKGCKTVRIPAILTQTVDIKEKKYDAPIIITYAGLPERKDKLVEILDSFSALSDDKKRKLELRIVGITLQQLQKRFNLSESQISNYKEGIVFYGRVQRQQVQELLKETHYTVFYRDASERYAKAGFPTKVAESMSHGVPVITNLSSDLSLYFVDGQNSIVISEGKSGIKESLEKVSMITKEQYISMVKASAKTYNSSFYYETYVESMKKFLE